MNCDGVRGLLSAYLDGELTPAELLRVEQHLRRCPACADEVDALRRTIALVASLDEIEVPPSFHAELHQRLVAQQPPALRQRRGTAHSTWRRPFMRWALPVAALATVAVTFGTLPQVRNLLGVKTQAGGLQVFSEETASDRPGSVTPEGASGAGGTGGISGVADSASGHGGQAPSSGGNEMTDLDSGAAADLPASTESRPGSTGIVSEGASGEAQAAGNVAAISQAPAQGAPMYSYSVSMVVSGVTRDQVVSALRNFQSTAEPDRILVTVPADERWAVVSAVRSLPGARLLAGPEEMIVDLAPQIGDMTSRLEADQEQLRSLQEQIALLEDAAALEETLRRQESLEERIAETSQGLERLKGQVNMARITVRVESGGQ